MDKREAQQGAYRPYWCIEERRAGASDASCHGDDRRVFRRFAVFIITLWLNIHSKLAKCV